MHAHVNFEFARIARFIEQRLALLYHFGRCQVVMLGAGDIELALHFTESEMRALDGVADEPGAVERRRGGDAVGVAGRSSQRIRAAHAVAVGADRASLALLLTVGPG